MIAVKQIQLLLLLKAAHHYLLWRPFQASAAEGHVLKCSTPIDRQVQIELEQEVYDPHTYAQQDQPGRCKKQPLHASVQHCFKAPLRHLLTRVESTAHPHTPRTVHDGAGQINRCCLYLHFLPLNVKRITWYSLLSYAVFVKCIPRFLLSFAHVYTDCVDTALSLFQLSFFIWTLLFIA